VKGRLSRRALLLLAVVAVAVLFIVAGSRAVVAFRTLRVLEPQPRSEAAEAITSGEAWEIALDYATKWQDDAILTRLASSDINDPNAQTSGGDGKRRTWIADLVSPDSDLRIRLQITDGVVVEAIEEPGVFDLPPVTEKPLVDSSDALPSVLAEKPGFAPGTGSGRGYHFVLQQSVLLVVGSYEQFPAIGVVDAKTGEVLSCRRHTTDSTGAVLFSVDAGVTWHVSDLVSNMVTSISPDPTHENSAYASVVNDTRVQVYQTRNGGRNWELLSELPPEVGNWAYSISVMPATSASNNPAVIAVGTPTGLWVSRGVHDRWERVNTLSEGPPQWTAVLVNVESPRILVSLTAGPNAGLYASEDASSWMKVADGVFRLSRSLDRKSVIAVDEHHTESGRAFVFDGANMSEIVVPPHTLRLAGNFTQGTNLLAESPNALFSGTLDARSGSFAWRESLSTLLAGLAVSPDFSSSGLAIASGFRTSVFRSTDYGESWEEVLSPQVLSESGTGETGSVEFLSDECVILVNGGAFTWIEF